MDIRKLQRAIVAGLEDVKGHDIVVFNTEHLTPLFERVIIASGNSNRQTKALASSVRETVKKRGLAVLRTEGEDNGEWIIVDCGAAVAHIMQPNIREYYRLEEIWGEKPVKLKLAGKADAGLPKAGATAAGATTDTALAVGELAVSAKAAAKRAPARKAAPAKTAPGRAAPTRKAASAKPSAKTFAKAPAGSAAKPPAKTAAKAPRKPAAKRAVNPAAKAAPRKAAPRKAGAR